MRRLLLIPLGVAILGGVAFGAPRVAVVFLPFALGVLVWATVAHRTTVPDPGWASSTRVPAPAAGPAPVAAPPGQTGESTPIVRALVGVEGRLLLTSAAFAVGLGFCALLIALFVFVWGGENTTPWSENLQTMPWLVHPLVGMTVLASHRAVTRGSATASTRSSTPVRCRGASVRSVTSAPRGCPSRSPPGSSPR